MGRSSVSAVLVVAVLLLSVLAAAVLVLPRRQPSFTTTYTVTTGVPPPYPVGYGVTMTEASYDNINQHSFASLTADLAMLASTHAQALRVDIGYDAWLNGNLTDQSEISSLIAAARQDGMAVIIADASAEYYRSHPLPWNQFEAAWVQRVTTLASLYHPDYYIVIKEPGWYPPMISGFYFDPGYSSGPWLSLLSQLVTAVRSASPQTQVGVSVDAGTGMTNHPAFYQQFLTGAESMGVFIGFDIYDQGAMANTQDFLQSHPPTVPVWIAETWDGSTPTCSSADAGWLTQMEGFTLAHHISWLVPFFTDCFSSNPPLFTQYTSSYYTFQEFAKFGTAN